MRSRAIFLDRDGVLNKSIIRDGRPYAPRRIKDFEILADAGAATRRLKVAGFLLIVVTNQPDMARGLISRTVVDEMHTHLRKHLPLDDIFVCECIEGPECPCYKPKPGLLHAAAEKWEIDFSRSYMVGDRWRDIEAGKAVGCHTILVDRGYWADRPAKAPDAVVDSLAEASAHILNDDVPSARSIDLGD